MTILAPCPWSERLVPCRVEGNVVVCVAGPVSKNVPLVAKDADREEFERLKRLGWSLIGEGGDDAL